MDVDKSAKKNTRRGVLKTVHEYAENATTHGISYACDTSLFPLERFLWVLVCVGFIIFAVYFISEAYMLWEANPVITSVQTTGWNKN